jgi:hypothetical protein
MMKKVSVSHGSSSSSSSSSSPNKKYVPSKKAEKCPSKKVAKEARKMKD